MQRGLIDLLACPVCYSALHLKIEAGEDAEVRQGELVCRGCGQHYPIKHGVPQMMPPHMLLDNAQWDDWAEKQTIGLQSYTAPDWEAKAYFDNVAVEFGAFCGLSGMILDVGCGVEPQPAYAVTVPGSTYIGVDPLEGDDKRPFDFVRGVGECLPFQAAIFDWVVSATSFDHFPDPAKVLAEVKRVLKPAGHLGLWVAVVDPDYFRRMYALPPLGDYRHPKCLWALIRQHNLKWLVGVMWRHSVINRVRSVMVRWSQRLNERALIDTVFEGRAMYHFHFYKEAEVLTLLAKSDYQVIKRQLITNVEHGNSLFVLAAPKQFVKDRL